MAVLTTYNCTRLTGGADRDLDNISVAELADGDRAIIADGSNNFRYFEFQASATDVEDTTNIPARVRPDDYSSAGVWYEQLSIALQKDGSVAITGDWNVDGANTLFVDKTNGRIGLGTTAPGEQLEVKGNVNIGNHQTDNALRITKRYDTTGSLEFTRGDFSTPDTILKSDEAEDFIIKVNVQQLATPRNFILKIGSGEVLRAQEAGNIGIGLTPTANMLGLSIEAGLLTLKETTTPTADADYGKIYTKSDNKLYFQDGAGTEHEIAFV